MSALDEPLLRWLDRPQADTGVHFATGQDGWDYRPYSALAARAAEIAAGLQARGIRRDDRVLITAKPGPEFLSAFYGTMLAGATAVPTAPPASLGTSEAYQTHLRRLVAVARPALILTTGEPDPFPLVGEAAALTAAGHAVDTSAMPCGASPRTAEQASLALIQFTSGSTSAPRGVRVPFSALNANVKAITDWLGGGTPASAHWLPPYHDMGLIGGLIVPVTAQAPLWTMSPMQFLRSPLRYLSLLGCRGARIGTMPNFGMEHILRKVRPEQLEGYDFRPLIALIMGAERLNPAVLDRFKRLLAPFGFRDTAFAPAYGLAEATLAVTGLPVTAAPVLSAPEGAKSGPVVGCGVPFAGTTVRVLDDAGRPALEGTPGLIEVTGPSVADGYEGAPAETFADGKLHTGDVGFLREGQLFVIGRLGDSLKVRGRSIFAEDLEMELAELTRAALPPVVLLGASSGGRPTVVALLRRPDRETAQISLSLLTARADGAEIVVLAVGDSQIERTTSGKPRRGLMWRRFAAGELQGDVVAGSDVLLVP